MPDKKNIPYHAIVIGTSAGGLDALGILLPALDPRLPVPVVIVQHISASSDSFMVTYFDRISSLTVKEIAHSLNFNDYPHFCRTFRKRTGMSPGKYRRSFPINWKLNHGDSDGLSKR